MTSQQEVFRLQEHPINFVQEGMAFGIKAGFRLSMLYAIFGTLLVFLVEVFEGGVGFLNWQTLGAFDWSRLIRATPLFLLAAFLILFAVIAPATIIGILTGMLLGKFVEMLVGRLSKYLLVLSCVVLCIILAVLIHLFFDVQIVFSFQPPQANQSQYFSMGIFETYPFYMGIPTIVYVLAGGWTGWKLYLKSLAYTDEKN